MYISLKGAILLVVRTREAAIGIGGQYQVVERVIGG